MTIPSTTAVTIKKYIKEALLLKCMTTLHAKIVQCFNSKQSFKNYVRFCIILLFKIDA